MEDDKKVLRMPDWWAFQGHIGQFKYGPMYYVNQQEASGYTGVAPGKETADVRERAGVLWPWQRTVAPR